MVAHAEKSDKSILAAIREMRSADVSAVISILRESPEAVMWPEKGLLEWSANGNVWVAEREGRVAGILTGRAAADELEILILAVGKEWRRQGVASQMVRAALDRAFAAGAQRAYLELRVSNTGALNFYEQLGFRACGRRSNYYRDPVEDAVLLVLHKADKIS
jgi:[ribosomal protein S18]-alanine N-acetyltransferase